MTKSADAKEIKDRIVQSILVTIPRGCITVITVGLSTNSSRICGKCVRKGVGMDEFDRFMTALEDAGILTGWTEFMNKKDDSEEVNEDDAL